MDRNDPDFDQDETVALEQQRADMFKQEMHRKYGRDCGPTACKYLINNTMIQIEGTTNV
jgi:hypothetical protein